MKMDHCESVQTPGLPAPTSSQCTLNPLPARHLDGNPPPSTRHRPSSPLTAIAYHLSPLTHRLLPIAYCLFFSLCLLPSGLAQVLLDAPAPAANNITSMEMLDDLQKLGNGDRISYRVIEDKEETKSLVVSDTGELDIPYLGRVKAADKTCKAVAKEIKVELEKDLYYRATVIVAVDLLNKRRGIVYLVGHVKTSGPQDIPSDETLTLTKAILRAGGFTDFANKKNVKVTRQTGNGANSNKVFIIDVTEILEKGKTDKDLKLEPGDLIYVSSRTFNM